MKAILLFFILVYQEIISPFLPHRCRYSPSCSEYAREAILTHGFIGGVSLACGRLMKCHPFSAGGVDMVPQTKGHKT